MLAPENMLLAKEAAAYVGVLLNACDFILCNYLQQESSTVKD